MSYIYKEINVYEEALNRIRWVFDNCDDVVVSMSGGKDSTVIFNLAMQVAKEKNRLPLKVMWLDQECEWQSTADYMKSIMYLPDVKPYWFQFPFDFTNSLSHTDNFLRVWDENIPEEQWCRRKDEISIKENPTGCNRFHDIIERLPLYCRDNEEDIIGALVGMRSQESNVRRLTIDYGKTKNKYKNIYWSGHYTNKTHHKLVDFYPISDWEFSDVWHVISKNKWRYNTIYDSYYKYGVELRDYRVSSLIHETAWRSVLYLQEIEPRTYDRFVNRVAGVSTFNHMGREGITLKKLPPFFSSWKEYRDYLLNNVVKPENRKYFMKYFKDSDTEDTCRRQIIDLSVNDIDLTHRENRRSGIDKQKKNKAKYLVKLLNAMKNEKASSR